MIDWNKYNDTFQWYGEDVEIELIGVYQEEFENRMLKIAQNVAERDFEQLKFNTHSLKGTISNYHDPEPVALALELELRAKESNPEGIDELLEQLKVSAGSLLEALIAHRNRLLAKKEGAR
jgi:HPt (histidine-containing phosphotransfer) domain-containing protein